MKSNITIAGGLVLFGAILFSTLHPTRIQADSTQVTEQGIVTEIYQTAFKDLVLKLKDHGKSYYIEGAFGDNLSFEELKEKVLYKSVKIEYPERWSPIKSENSKHYISKLEHNGEIIFQE
jgi:hypothetical protein